MAAKVKKKKLTRFELTLLMLILPFMLFIIAFSYVPVLCWSMAFVKYSPGLSIFKSQFKGLYYFSRIFIASSDFGQVMINTLVLSFLNIIASPLPILLAIMVTEMKSKKYQRVVQTVTALPNFISWIIVYGIAMAFFSRDDGIVNKLLLQVGLIKDPSNILANNNLAWYVQTLFAIWKGTGWSAIIYFGAICGIDRELYEAAQIDGAGRLKLIRHITIPGVMPTYTILLLLSVGSLLSGASFEQMYVFNNAYVTQHLQTLDLYVYFQGITHSNYSYSTAVGIFKTLVSVLLLFICNGVSRRTTGHSII